MIKDTIFPHIEQTSQGHNIDAINMLSEQDSIVQILLDRAYSSPKAIETTLFRHEI